MEKSYTKENPYRMHQSKNKSYSFLKNDVFPDKIPPSTRFIPRKIWQTCKDQSSMQPQLLHCVSELKKMNSNWEHTLFDDKSQYEYIKSVCSNRFLEAYERIHPLFGAPRADLFRYLIVFLHGGAYFDLKSGTARPLDDILISDDLFILSQWDNGPDGKFPGGGIKPQLKNIPGGEYEQWNVIATPGHPFLAAVIEQVLTNIESYNAVTFGHGAKGCLNVFGPHAFTLAINPLLKEFPHRKVISWTEGIKYTMFEGDDKHYNLDPLHYSRHIIAPVHSGGLKGWNRLKYWLAEFAIWPLSQLRIFNYRRLRSRRNRKFDRY